MILHTLQFRVLYPDTDKMGTMHHSNYAKYYEWARWELFRNIGIPYHKIEENGVMCPVIRMQFHFLKTVHYDELLTITTRLKSIKGVRIWFTYQIYNKDNELVNEAETELAFVDMTSWKPVPPPDFLLKAIKEHHVKH